jgi:hypothetical protein
MGDPLNYRDSPKFKRAVEKWRKRFAAIPKFTKGAVVPKNKNGDVFVPSSSKKIKEIRVTTSDGTPVGVLREIEPGSLRHIDKVERIHELSMDASVPKERRGVAGEVSRVWTDPNPMWGPSPLLEVIRDLIYLDLLNKANAAIFYDRYADLMTAQQREDFMEKYGVQIDKSKVPKKGKDGEKTAGVDDPNVNVPKHPTEGTEPFEKKPDGE